MGGSARAAEGQTSSDALSRKERRMSGVPTGVSLSPISIFFSRDTFGVGTSSLKVEVVLEAPVERVFEHVTDFQLRLEWDSMLMRGRVHKVTLRPKVRRASRQWASRRMPEGLRPSASAVPALLLLYLTSPHLTSLHLASPRLTSPHLTAGARLQQFAALLRDAPGDARDEGLRLLAAAVLEEGRAGRLPRRIALSDHR